MKFGDFTDLAKNYSRYRPSYNKKILKKIIQLTNILPQNIRAADIGAGTGIFTKCLLDMGIKDIIALEPNDNMIIEGKKFLNNEVSFRKKYAENTGLESNSFDFVSMASSFHWTNTKNALTEIHRILKLDGIFLVIYNPRLTHKSVCENEIQLILMNKYKIKKRISSGLSGITDDLDNLLKKNNLFGQINYFEEEDIIFKSREEYIGVWKSVNDIRSQLGEIKFGEFLTDVKNITKKFFKIDSHYLTRAWVAKKSN